MIFLAIGKGSEKRRQLPDWGRLPMLRWCGALAPPSRRCPPPANRLSLAQNRKADVLLRGRWWLGTIVARTMVDVVVFWCGRWHGAQAPSRFCRRRSMRLSLAIHRKAVDGSGAVQASQGTLEDGRIRW